MAMDSKAVFARRVVQLGCKEFQGKFEENGWATFGEFAFATTYVPGHAEDGTFDRDITEKITDDKTHVKRNVFRRLFFEAYTMAIADMKRRVEGKTDSEAPRKLPVAEREDRYDRQQERLKCLKLRGQLECADALVDKAIAMFDENMIAYIPWDACLSKDAEASSLKFIKELRPDANGFLKEFFTTASGSADVSSDLLLKYALTRRGLALDQAELMTFETHELLVDLFFEEYLRPALPGYRRVTVEQLNRADVEMFRMLRERTRGGVQALDSGSKPLDAAMEKVLDSTKVRMLLMPLGGGSSQGQGGQQHRREVPEQTKNDQRIRRTRTRRRGRSSQEGS